MCISSINDLCAILLGTFSLALKYHCLFAYTPPPVMAVRQLGAQNLQLQAIKTFDPSLSAP